MISRIFVFCLIFCFPLVGFAKCNSSEFDSIIFKAAKRYSVDPALIHAVIKQESCYRLTAVSHAGAQGLMQLIPATADRFNVKNAFDANQNIFAGTKYLSWLLKRFKGNISFALAGYNAGEGRVDQYNGIPPYKETQNYVVKVLANYNNFKGISKASKKTVIAKNITPKNNAASILKVIKRTEIKSIASLDKKDIPVSSSVIEPTNFETKRTKIRSVTVAMNSKYERVGYKIIRSRVGIN